MPARTGIAESGVRLSGLSASLIESFKLPLGVFAGDVHGCIRCTAVTDGGREVDDAARALGLHHAQLVERMTSGDPASAQALATLQAGGMGQQQSYGVLNRLVDQQAFMLSANDLFYVSGLLFLGLIFVVWLAQPTKAASGAAGAAASGAH